jgi:hypothetical protein
MLTVHLSELVYGPASLWDHEDAGGMVVRGVQKRMGWEDGGKQTEEESPEGLSTLKFVGCEAG